MSKANKSGRMWNIIWKSKNLRSVPSAISIKTEEYFTAKFDENMSKTDLILSAEKTVMEKYQACSLDILPDYIISEYSVIKNIKSLKSGTAPGIDGITADHLK